MRVDESYAPALRIVGVGVLALGVVLGVATFAISLSGPVSLTLRSVVHAMGLPFVMVAVGMGVCAALWTLAAPSAPSGNVTPPPFPQAMPAVGGQVGAELAALRAEVAGLSARLDQTSGAPPLMMPAAAPPAAIDGESLDGLYEMIRELRELALMSDEQRRSYLAAASERRKQQGLAGVLSCIEQRQWAPAEQYLGHMEQEHPGDAEVAKLREQVRTGRAAEEGEAYRSMAGEVEDLMAMTNFDAALGRAQQFLAAFPGNPDATHLVARVARERDLHREGNVKALVEEVKRQAERRQWRKALAAARRLVEQFPGHKLSDKVSGQLPTLTENADIEERHEREQEIQGLIARKRYVDATKMAEELMSSFPSSPQAEKLRAMMPKLKELAWQEETRR